MTEKTMIQFEHVSKVYGDKTVVNDINLTIENGEFITILGTSGSGKTTMLKMINKLIEPTSGTIFFAGQDIEQMDSVSLRRQIGYVVQQIGLFPHMTVAENIATVPKLLGWDKERIDAITRTDLQEELQAIHQKLSQKTFVFITHDIYEAFKLGTRVVIMDNGTICQFDTPENIIKNPGNEFVQRLITTAQEQEKLWRASYD